MPATTTVPATVAIREGAHPLTGSVLLGDASHGTHEFYHGRARITRRLIKEGIRRGARGSGWVRAARSKGSSGSSIKWIPRLPNGHYDESRAVEPLDRQRPVTTGGRMRGQDKFVAGLIVGAGAMYLLDPDRGAGRRSLLRDRWVHLGDKLGTARSTEPGPRQDAWTPTTRLVLGTAGGVMALQGVRMKGPGGRALTLLGSGLLSRAASQVPPPPVAETTEAEAPAKPVTPRATAPEHPSKSTAQRRRSRR